MDGAQQPPLRRSTRLAALQHQKRHQGACEPQQAPEGKRPCKAGAASMARAGSVDSDCTLIGAPPPAAFGAAAAALAEPPPAPPAALDASSPASDAGCCAMADLTPCGYGSDDSQQTPLDAALLQHPQAAAACAAAAAAAAVPSAAPSVAIGVPAGYAVPAQPAQEQRGAAWQQQQGWAGAAAAAAPPAPPPPQQQQSEPDSSAEEQASDDDRHFRLPPTYLAELAVANERVGRLPLPDGMPLIPVHESCQLLPICCVYGVSPAAVVLGASYFQRILARKTCMRQAAEAAGYFSYRTGGEGQPQLMMHCRYSPEPVVVAALTTCVYLGAKMCEGVICARQLSAMLASAMDERVTHEEAVTLETQVLHLLNWRLGPYCCKPRQMGPW